MQVNTFKRSLVAAAIVGAFGVGAVTAERVATINARGRRTGRRSRRDARGQRCRATRFQRTRREARACGRPDQRDARSQKVAARGSAGYPTSTSCRRGSVTFRCRGRPPMARRRRGLGLHRRRRRRHPDQRARRRRMPTKSWCSSPTSASSRRRCWVVDKTTDIAVLKIDAKDLPVARRSAIPTRRASANGWSRSARLTVSTTR